MILISGKILSNFFNGSGKIDRNETGRWNISERKKHKHKQTEKGDAKMKY